MPSSFASPSPNATSKPEASKRRSVVGPAVGKRKNGRSKSRSKPLAPRVEGTVLGRYLDAQGRSREICTRSGADDSTLVIDRDATTLGDLRLVAHLGADEPPTNAGLVCRDYLSHPAQRWCRSLTAEDLQAAPFAERAARAPEPANGGLLELLGGTVQAQATAVEIEAKRLLDRQGSAYRLLSATTGMTIPELRWHRFRSGPSGTAPEPVGLREVVAALESYEPARTLTTTALVRYRDDPCVSTYGLGAELERLDGSRIVLNRGLREAVEAAVASGSVSMSEITIRCGRLKRAGRRAAGGDTSWLARRIGLMPEGGRSGMPTPWVHSEVLALIARHGLGISPREVELG